MRLTKIKSVLLCGFLVLSLTVNGQVPPGSISDSLQKILDASLPPDFIKGGAVLEVFVPGQWTWSSATGYAISGGTPGQPASMATPQHQFRCGSISKTMLATCVLMMQEEGLLHVDDPISNYLRATLVDDTLASSGVIKIKHLLNHTSGIANSGDNNDCQMDVLNNPEGSHTLEEAVYCGASQGEIFPPEFAWAYSNTNYSLLAMLIESVSGQSYASYITEKLFIPAGLDHTEIPFGNQIENPHMGCYWNIGNWIDLTIINPTTYTGWADIVTTTSDLNKFHHALRSGTLITANSFQAMNEVLAGSYDYGFGYDEYLLDETEYRGHYGEVANSSGMFFADVASTLAPDGYYVAYNFNVQGADMSNKIDIPVYDLLVSNSNSSSLVEAKLDNASVLIYPNPAIEVLNVDINGGKDAGSIVLFDVIGNVVYKVQVTPNSSNFTIDCTEFRSGVYMLQYTSGTRIENHKISIQ
jgi:CubicO group peptidase (beta-lactamase class C family)